MSNDNNNVFYLDSYTRGRVTQLEVSKFATLGALLEEENISMSNAYIMFKDAKGNAKEVAANTAIEAGDSIDIQNASNKSGK